MCVGRTEEKSVWVGMNRATSLVGSSQLVGFEVVSELVSFLVESANVRIAVLRYCLDVCM